MNRKPKKFTDEELRTAMGKFDTDEEIAKHFGVVQQTVTYRRWRLMRNMEGIKGNIYTLYNKIFHTVLLELEEGKKTLLEITGEKGEIIDISYSYRYAMLGGINHGWIKEEIGSNAKIYSLTKEGKEILKYVKRLINIEDKAARKRMGVVNDEE